MDGGVLTRRASNRALLARQMLLRRETLSPVTAIERLAGLPAREARPPFISLWSRLSGFRRDGLRRLLRERQVVRGALMRGGLHMVSAADYPRFRASIQDSLEHISQALMRDGDVDLSADVLGEEALAILAGGPQTLIAVRAGLAIRHPEQDPGALLIAPRLRLPLLTAPTGGRWAFDSHPTFEPASEWLEEPVARRPDPQGLVRRFLAAWGPATVAEARAWSGLPRLEAVFDALAGELVTFHDERGRLLHDLPEAPRPDEDAPAPPRLLPEGDGLLLGHVDPWRTTLDSLVPHFAGIGGGSARILADGFAIGSWKTWRRRGEAVLALRFHARVSRKDRLDLEAEANALLQFIEPEAASRTVRFETV